MGMKKKIMLIRNAHIMPFQGTMDRFMSGVFQNGVCLEESLIRKRASPSSIMEPTKKLAGAYLYGGYLFGHFGHFCLESLSRAYAFRQSALLPILFVSPNNTIATWQRYIFKFLGFSNELILLDEPVEVEQLVFSVDGCTIEPPCIIDEQLAALAVRSFAADAPCADKVWLSRSATTGGGLENEIEIEAALEQIGWTIVHPEKYPIAEQVRVIASARHVAGIDGSAFYSALFAKKINGHFTLFSRFRGVPPMLRHALSCKNIPFDNVRDLPLELVSGVNAECRYILKKPECIINRLRHL